MIKTHIPRVPNSTREYTREKKSKLYLDSKNTVNKKATQNAPEKAGERKIGKSYKFFEIYTKNLL